MTPADGTPRLRDGFARQLTSIVAAGITGRGPSALCGDGVWQEAVDLLHRSARIAIVSGFYVPAVSAPETDGPPGALVLARALLRMDRDVFVWTDSLCLDCFKACAAAIGFPPERVVDASVEDAALEVPNLLIYVERLGRAADGAFYNMRREDITQWTPALDSFALSGETPVIGIGDGGNEVGMGNLVQEMSQIDPSYAHCLCVVKSDACIPVDVSNWGAYALAAALSATEGKWLGQSRDEERAMLEALCACGVVDGVTKRCELSVDGLALDEQLKIRDALEDLAARAAM